MRLGCRGAKLRRGGCSRKWRYTRMFFRPTLFLCIITINAVGSPRSACNAEGPVLPEIISTQENSVPSCTAPIKLMQFVDARNAALKPPRSIDAKFYDL